MKRLGFSVRAWKFWGLINAGFAGLFILLAESIKVVAPSHQLLILENLILGAIFGGIAGICTFLVEFPVNIDQNTTQESEKISKDGENGVSPVSEPDDEDRQSNIRELDDFR